MPALRFVGDTDTIALPAIDLVSDWSCSDRGQPDPWGTAGHEHGECVALFISHRVGLEGTRLDSGIWKAEAHVRATER